MPAGLIVHCELRARSRIGLHFVRELLDLPQLHKAGKSLNGVKSPENCVQGLAIGGFAFQGEDLGLDLDQVLPAFDDKVRHQLRIPRNRLGWRDTLPYRRLEACWRLATPSCNTEETVSGSAVEHSAKARSASPKDAAAPTTDSACSRIAAAEIPSSTGTQADAFRLVFRLPNDQLESHVLNLLPQRARRIHSETFQKLFSVSSRGKASRLCDVRCHRHRCRHPRMNRFV